MEKIINSALEKRKLPSIFKMPDGRIISNKEEWEKIARPYWKEVLLKEEYGAVLPYVKPSISLTRNGVDFSGKAFWDQVDFAFEYNGKKHVVPTQLIMPNKKPQAVFVYLNFRPEIPDRYLPVEEIIDNGFAVFVVCYNDVTTDNGDFSNGLAGLFQVG
jgi:hypothetical protein